MFKTLRDSLKFLLDDDFDYDSYMRSSRDGKKIFRKLIDVLKYCQRNDEEFTSFINDCVDDFDYYDEVSIDDVKSIIILYMEYVVQTIRECKLDAGSEAYGIFDEIADFDNFVCSEQYENTYGEDLNDDLMEVAFEEVFPKLFQKIAHTKYPIEY